MLKKGQQVEIICGKDKGNLEFVKKLVTEKNLDDEVYFVDFVSEEEMVLLYKKCLALVMPTYVARSTLPLYEAFYFKVPVFYSKGILDKSLEKFVVTFDLNDFASLATKLCKLVSCWSKFFLSLVISSSVSNFSALAISSNWSV